MKQKATSFYKLVCDILAKERKLVNIEICLSNVLKKIVV